GASLSGLDGVSIGSKTYAFGGDARYGVLLKADTADTYWQAGSGGVLYNKADATLTLTNAEVGTLGSKTHNTYFYAGLLLDTGSPLTLKLAGASTVANAQVNVSGSLKWGLYSTNALTIENAADGTEGSLTVCTYPNAGADSNSPKAALYVGSGNLTINSGSVTATATTPYCYGVQLWSGSLTMYGGSLSATGKSVAGINNNASGSIMLFGDGVALTAESDTDPAVYVGDGSIILTGNGATLSATSGGGTMPLNAIPDLVGDGYWWDYGSVLNEANAYKSRYPQYDISPSGRLTLRNHVHSYAADAAQNLAYDTEAHWQACENPNCPGKFSSLPLYGAHTYQNGASNCDSCAFQPIKSVTAAVENSSQTAVELVYGCTAAPTLAVTVDPIDLTGAAYQWYTVTDSGTTEEYLTPIENATDSTYTPPAGLEVGSYIYRCRVIAHGAYTDSKDVALTVKQAQTSLTGSLPAANPVYGSSIETAATFANTGLAATGAVTLPAAVDASLGENQTGTFLLQNGSYTLLGTAQTVANGAVGFAIDTTQLGAGTHPLEIYYKGTANLSHAVYRFDLTVEPRPVTVTAHDQTITYGTPPALGSECYTIAAPTAATGLLGGHSLTATLVPSTDQVTENGQLQLSEVVITDGIGRVVTANYAVDALPGRLIIQRRLVTILPDAGQNNPYDGTGSTPALGYTLDGLAGSEMLSGSIDRTPGTAAGQYAYTPGTFTEANHPNYTFAMVQNADRFTITPLDLGSASTEITLGNRPMYSGSPLVQTVAAVIANDLVLAPGDYTTTNDCAIKVGVYQLTVTGQGNFAGSASVLWQVYPNTGSISGVTEQTVTAENAEAITALKQSAADAIAAAAGDPNTLATPQDIAQWTVVVNGCDALLQQIEDAQQAAETEHITGTAAVTDQNVALADKADLQAAQTDLQAALNDYAGNYTDTQRAEVQADLDRVTGALNSIAAVETLTDKVTALPAAADILPDTEPAISNVAAAWNAYTALTSHEKSLLSTDTVTALQAAYAAMTDYRMVKAQHENSFAELQLNDAHWTRGMANGLVFVANGAAHKLAAVLVDGVVVDPAGYTVRSGSTLVTLQPGYLHTLALGGHTVTFRYPDGEASARFTVYESPALSATSPKTGPGVSLWPMTAALGVAAIAFAALRRKAKRS
ncbi:MAG: hypothetical protein IJ347_06060, partial [Faecalibacterium sp.]|nr:hypothetical protein [Faecalibacterium sp.]